MGHWRTDTDRGKPKYSEKNLAHASLAKINPSWTGLGFISCLRDEKPGTDRVIHGTAHLFQFGSKNVNFKLAKTLFLIDI